MLTKGNKNNLKQEAVYPNKPQSRRWTDNTTNMEMDMKWQGNRTCNQQFTVPEKLAGELCVHENLRVLARLKQSIDF